MISQGSQRREGPLLARQTGAVLHLASTPPLLCPASGTRLHGFSLCLIQISFYKMLKMGLIVSQLVFALHTTCTDTHLPGPCHSFKLHFSGYLLFWEVQGQTPHLPIPKPLTLKGSRCYHVSGLPQYSANYKNSVYLHVLIPRNWSPPPQGQGQLQEPVDL